MAALIRKIISTPKAPRPLAPYNQAVVVDRTVYVSGVLGLDKETLKIVEGGVAAETKQALTYLGYILEAADSGLDRVVKTTVLLNDINDFGSVNEVYKQFFTENFPARACFQVGCLPAGARVEIEAVAVTGSVNTISPKL